MGTGVAVGTGAGVLVGAGVGVFVGCGVGDAVVVGSPASLVAEEGALAESLVVVEGGLSEVGSSDPLVSSTDAVSDG